MSKTEHSNHDELLLRQQIWNLQCEVRELCQKIGWRTPESGARLGHEFAAYIALAHSELSEALDAYRDHDWSSTREADGKPTGVGPELADVFIRLLDMCDIWGINLVGETERVLEYGWTRPFRHGGREL